MSHFTSARATRRYTRRPSLCAALQSPDADDQFHHRQLRRPRRNYDGSTDWSAHESATIANTSPRHFDAVCRDIAMAGFENVDVWMAHCHWKYHSREDHLEIVKGILSQYDLAIASYAGGLHVDKDPNLEAPFRFMKQLGAPLLAGGLWGGDAAALTPQIHDICEKVGVRYAFENHPESSIDEILSKIAHGKYANVGLALDTGWCATHGIDALEALKRLRPHLFIVHLKDIKEAGKHETCILGDGIVPIEKIVRHLVQTSYQGTLCLEHEPYDRDPMPEIMTSLERVRSWLK